MKHDKTGVCPSDPEAKTTFVTIPLKEYLELKEDEHWLQCLQDAGVDNWQGISYAYELFGKKDEEDD